MSRVSALTRKRWFLPSLVVGVVAVVFLQQALFGNDSRVVVRELKARYGLEEVVWEGNGRYQRDTLVIDGRDVSDDCAIVGDWGSLDDLAISCNDEVDFVPVDRRSDGDAPAD